jgi:hypothetical protein
MSQTPPPPIGYYPVPPPARPTSVTVLAIIGIVLASLSLICTPFQLIGAFMGGAAGSPNPMMSTPILSAWTIGSSILGVLLAVGLLIGCIGSLRLAGWGRKLMLAVAVVSIVFAVVGAVMNGLVVVPAMMNSPEMAQMPQEQRQVAMAFGGGVGACCALLVGAVYPICVLVFFSKESVKQAFSGVPAMFAPPYMPSPPPPPPTGPAV